MLKNLKELLEFCFSSVWIYCGLTIWLLIFTGNMQKKIIPSLVNKWNKFKTLFQREYKKNLSQDKSK